MITLEDINTWLTLFDFDMPIELDLTNKGSYELYDWDRNDDEVLSPKFNHDNTYFTIEDTSVVFRSDGSLKLEDYPKLNPFYLFPQIAPITSTTPQLVYFYPSDNINRLLFEDDDLRNRRLHINYYGNVAREINGYSPFRDEYGEYVPMVVVKDSTISCDVSGSRTFTPRIDYVYAPPVISVVEDLFIGNNNVLSDKITCEASNFKVYYNNKEISDLSVPSEDYRDVYRLKVVTVSEYPYIPSEKYVEVRTSYKYLSDLSEIADYSYLMLDRDLSFTHDERIVIDGTCTINGDGHSISDAYFEVTGNLTFENVIFDCPFIYVDGEVTFKDCTFRNTDTEIDYMIVNNGTVKFNESTIQDNGYIVNNNNLRVVSSILTIKNKVMDLPFIHNIGTVNITGNEIGYTDTYTSNNIMFIRGIDDVDDLIKNNTFDYTARLTIDEEEYLVAGNGVCYGNIDDDTLKFKELEVS